MFSRNVKFYENIFPFKLTNSYDLKKNERFANSFHFFDNNVKKNEWFVNLFPFFDTNVVNVYEEIVLDRADDS